MKIGAKRSKVELSRLKLIQISLACPFGSISFTICICVLPAIHFRYVYIMLFNGALRFLANQVYGFDALFEWHITGVMSRKLFYIPSRVALKHLVCGPLQCCKFLIAL